MSDLHRCSKEGCETQVDGMYCLAHVPVRTCAYKGCIRPHVSGKYCDIHLSNPGMRGSGRIVRMYRPRKVDPPVVDPPVVDPVVERVVASFQARSEVGQKTYGTTLARTDLTTLQWIQHLQEELMDAVLYLERLKEEVE
jgi:hypothetical protein